tara:strand:+ start:696 stop:860 length:165 start_codon:yes stop_codon:yes gene_type:complete
VIYHQKFAHNVKGLLCGVKNGKKIGKKLNIAQNVVVGCVQKKPSKLGFSYKSWA